MVTVILIVDIPRSAAETPLSGSQLTAEEVLGLRLGNGRGSESLGGSQLTVKQSHRSPRQVDTRGKQVGLIEAALHRLHIFDPQLQLFHTCIFCNVMADLRLEAPELVVDCGDDLLHHLGADVVLYLVNDRGLNNLADLAAVSLNTPLLNGPIRNSRDPRSGILHIVRDP